MRVCPPRPAVSATRRAGSTTTASGWGCAACSRKMWGTVIDCLWYLIITRFARCWIRHTIRWSGAAIRRGGALNTGWWLRVKGSVDTETPLNTKCSSLMSSFRELSPLFAYFDEWKCVARHLCWEGRPAVEKWWPRQTAMDS